MITSASNACIYWRLVQLLFVSRHPDINLRLAQVDVRVSSNLKGDKQYGILESRSKARAKAFHY